MDLLDIVNRRYCKLCNKAVEKAKYLQSIGKFNEGDILPNEFKLIDEFQELISKFFPELEFDDKTYLYKYSNNDYTANDS